MAASKKSKPASKKIAKERYMNECGLLGIKQIFTSFNNPKGNAETERMIRAMKEELIWSNDFHILEQLR